MEIKILKGNKISSPPNTPPKTNLTSKNTEITTHQIGSLQLNGNKKPHLKMQ